MSDPNVNEPVEPTPEALSPEALAILAKARRSFGITMGVLLVGFMAIGIALVYRVVRDRPPVEMPAHVELPGGAEVVSSLVADGAINVTYRSGGVTTLALFDQATGALIRTIEIQPAP